jgi:ankyrin repeat protein
VRPLLPHDNDPTHGFEVLLLLVPLALLFAAHPPPPRLQAVLRQLLAAGADPNVRSSSGSSPLLEAAMDGSTAIQVGLCAFGGGGDTQWVWVKGGACLCVLGGGMRMYR